jgi:endonuclease
MASRGCPRPAGAILVGAPPTPPATIPDVRLVIARCTVDYTGRLTAHLPLGTRLIMLKADGSVLVHADCGSYKPLNWMMPPCSLTVAEPDDDQRAAGVTELWQVRSRKTPDTLVISIHEIVDEMARELGDDPGLVKDGVEAHLQELLADQIELLGPDCRLVRREYATAIGPVDIMARDGNGDHIAVELKRRGDIDGVEQLTRYLELLNRDPLLAPVHGVFAAQEIRPQARTLAEDRGIRCLVLDYEAMRGVDDADERLF